MVTTMSDLLTKLRTDTWVTATWDEYIKAIAAPECDKAKGYYYNDKMRIEMPPLGDAHSLDHSIVMFAVNLFATLKGIDINGRDNCTYRKTGCREAQPDASYYVGENVNAIPRGTGVIDLDIYPPPTLVIEVANTSLADDKGEKRLLYEDLGVSEYWIIDVQNAQVIAFAIANGGSRKIRQSDVLTGLDLSILEEALRRSRETNHGKVGAWLLSQLQ
jgi:Uma2 family endonuclease